MNLVRLLLATLFGLVFSQVATAAPFPLVEGRQNGFWNVISDGDHTSNQAVTDFGNVDVGSSVDRRYRLTNVTDGILQWQGFSSQDGQFEVRTTGGNVQGFNTSIPIVGGTTREFLIRFTPTTSGNFSPIVTLQTNAASLGAGSTFEIEGVGRAPKARFSGRQGSSGGYDNIADGETTLRLSEGTDFGFIPTGSSVVRQFKLTNDGNVALDPGSAFFSGGNTGDFTINGLSLANLGAGSERTFTITFAPGTTGTKSTTFTFLSDDPANPSYTFRVGGEAVAFPNIRVRGLQGTIPTDIDDGDTIPDQQVTQYGNVLLGSPGTRNFRILNEGNGPLKIFSISSSNPAFTIPEPPESVPPNDNTDFVINFSPNSPGVATTLITIESDSPGDESSYTFALTGTGVVPDARVSGRQGASGGYDNILDGESVPTLSEGTDFGTIPIGSPVTRWFKVTNDGSADLKLNSTNFVGGNRTEFSVGGLTLGRIKPGENKEFTITWTPQTPGSKSTTFWLVSDDPDENPYDFKLVGEAVAFPNIRLRGLQGIVATDIDDEDLVPDQDVTDFGEVTVLQGKRRSYRIVNDGNGALKVNNLGSNSSRFVVSSIITPFTILPGDTVDFDVDFTPISIGTVFATITVESNSPGDEATYTFAIKGTGSGPEIVVEGLNPLSSWRNINDGSTGPDTRNGTRFRDTNITGDSTSRSFRVRNTGNKNLRLTGRDFQGSGESHFSVSGLLAGNPFADIGPGGTRTFLITFDPSSVGSKLATFVLENNDPSESTFTFQVGGTAISEPVLSLEGREGGTFTSWETVSNGDNVTTVATGTEFAAVAVGGDPITKNFRVTNTGDGVLSISSITSSSPDFQIGTTPSVLSPGQSQVFDIHFNPTNIGFLESTITIDSDSYDPQGRDDFTFAVRGYSWDNVSARVRAGGISSDHLFNSQVNIQGFSFGGFYTGWTDISHNNADTRSGNATDFGTVQFTGSQLLRNLLPVDTQTHFYRVWNDGGQPMVISSVSLSSTQYRFQDLSFYRSNSQLSYSGDPAGDYRQVGSSVRLKPGEHITFSVKFDPTIYGRHDGEIRINTNSATSTPAPFIIKITGFGDTDEGPEISFTPVGSAFNFSAENGGSHVRTYQIFNTGNEILSVSSVVSSDPARFTVADAPSIVTPGGSAPFTITYHAPATGFATDTAVLTITSNDPDDDHDRPVVRSLRGSPLPPQLEIENDDGIPIANGTLEPSEVTDFGSISTFGNSENRYFLLRNTQGDGPLVIESINTGSPNFTVTGGPDEIAAGDYAWLNVRYRPLEVTGGGTEVAILSIRSNDPDDDLYEFAISGTAPGPPALAEIVRYERNAFGNFITVWYTGRPGETYFLEMSTDLETWEIPPGRNELPGSFLPFPVLVPGVGIPQRNFMRLGHEE